MKNWAAGIHYFNRKWEKLIWKDFVATSPTTSLDNAFIVNPSIVYNYNDQCQVTAAPIIRNCQIHTHQSCALYLGLHWEPDNRVHWLSIIIKMLKLYLCDISWEMLMENDCASMNIYLPFKTLHKNRYAGVYIKLKGENIKVFY